MKFEQRVNREWIDGKLVEKNVNYIVDGTDVGKKVYYDKLGDGIQMGMNMDKTSIQTVVKKTQFGEIQKMSFLME